MSNLAGRRVRVYGAPWFDGTPLKSGTGCLDTLKGEVVNIGTCEVQGDYLIINLDDGPTVVAHPKQCKVLKEKN